MVDDDNNLHSPPLKKLRKTTRRQRKTVVASVVTPSPTTTTATETNLKDPPGVAPLSDESDEANEEEEEEEIIEPICFLQPNLGDRVFCKYSNGEWYWGVVKNKFWKRNYLYYSVSYFILFCFSAIFPPSYFVLSRQSPAFFLVHTIDPV